MTQPSSAAESFQPLSLLMSPHTARTLLLSRTHTVTHDVMLVLDSLTYKILYRLTRPTSTTVESSFLLGPGWQPLWQFHPSHAPTEQYPLALVSPALQKRVLLCKRSSTASPGGHGSSFKYEFTTTHTGGDTPWLFVWKRSAFSSSLRCDVSQLASTGRATERQLACKLDASTRAEAMAQRIKEQYPARVESISVGKTLPFVHLTSVDTTRQENRLEQLLVGQDVIGILEYPLDGFVHAGWSDMLESLIVVTAVVLNEVVRNERVPIA